jgi:protein TonB
MNDTAVEVNLVTSIAPESAPNFEPPPQAPAPPAPEPPPPPEPVPKPEPSPPKPEAVPERVREPAQATPKPEPRRAPQKPARPGATPSNAAPTGALSSSTGGTAARRAGPTTGARPRSNPRPTYPPEARRLRQQGRVIVAAQVSVDGRATSVSLIRSSGFPLLDAAAVNAVRHWTFVPAQAAGIAIPSRVEVPVNFTLSP